MSCTLSLGGMEAHLHAPGLLWLPDIKLLCASDLHFEKGSFFHRYASPLPPYDTEATLALLAAAIDRFRPASFVALGDSFHDQGAFARMRSESLKALDRLMESVGEWIWIEGNHDALPAPGLKGTHREEHRTGSLCFRHIADPGGADWEVSGHYHPKARLSLKGHSISAPCFVHCGKRLIMPAFGSYTGGLDVMSADFRALFPAEETTLYLVREERVYPW